MNPNVVRAIRLLVLECLASRGPMETEELAQEVLDQVAGIDINRRYEAMHLLVYALADMIHQGYVVPADGAYSWELSEGDSEAMSQYYADSSRGLLAKMNITQAITLEQFLEQSEQGVGYRRMSATSADLVRIEWVGSNPLDHHRHTHCMIRVESGEGIVERIFTLAEVESFRERLRNAISDQPSAFRKS